MTYGCVATDSITSQDAIGWALADQIDIALLPMTEHL
jgi:hypothetical protein